MEGGSHFNFTINSKNESCEHDTLIFDRSTVASSLVEDFGFVCEKYDIMKKEILGHPLIATKLTLSFSPTTIT